jgi:mannose-6-phosphate isomerase
LNGEIFHIRPSGNAPEMRDYAVADTEERAGQLVHHAVREGGVLRRLEGEARKRERLQSFCRQPVPVRLHGVIQHYPWGGTSFIPELVGQANPEAKPLAELWLGAHPAASSLVEIESAQHELTRLIELAPETMLGPQNVASFGRQLPFLLKILDARHMLSIQVHPTRSQAESGFERENVQGINLDAPERNYRDPNPKPEIHVALSTFYMLHGFRPLEEIAEQLQRTAELRPLMPDFGSRLHQASNDPDLRSELLRELYQRAMQSTQPEVDRILKPLVKRLKAEQPTDPGTPEYWALQAALQYRRPRGGCDRGLFSIYLLNLVCLEPGESTFQDAGTLHAYLRGTTVELMANSDNVLRGGLTSKHIDVPELLSVVRWVEGRPQVSRGEPTPRGELRFPCPAKEFELRQLTLGSGARLELDAHAGPSCLIVLEGRVSLQSGNSEMCAERGTSAFVPWNVSLSLTGLDSQSTVFRAVIP